MSLPEQYVFDFTETAPGGRELLGGKGAGLAEMIRIGLPVPAGFTITTRACVRYMHDGRRLPPGLEQQIDAHVQKLEEQTGKRFDDPSDPLLVSVRSGAAVSMPGMMDTILNLGLNDAAAQGLARTTGNPRFAYDSYRRLIQMYGDVVAEAGSHVFESELADLKRRRGVEHDVQLTAEDLEGLIERFKAIYLRATGNDFPQDPREQLMAAVRAVFNSWETPRAKVYRGAHGIPDDLGTAVNVVQMVFGNKGSDSGTGVAFTRNPSTGEGGLYGEFLVNAQGEDVVAGIRTPEQLPQMKSKLPRAFNQLMEAMQTLERHYRDMQDIEFTVEEGRLYILQTRSGKRTAAAALRIAIDMVAEDLITREEAVMRIEPAQLDQLLHPMLDPTAKYEVAATGLNASPGAAVGKIALDADSAEERGKQGEAVILVRWETTPDDIHGVIQARGVLTAHGGMTSHAAVVARGMGKPCVAGCDGLTIDSDARSVRIGDLVLTEGDTITIDGGTGRVIAGEAKLVPPRVNEDFETVLGWADKIRRLKVMANADTPEDARRARELGAEGIGLCRTEHMFMQQERLPVVREMIMAETEDERRESLDRLLPMQQSDFEGIFEAMDGLPVTIRLLDPPLHEFLPPEEEAVSEHMRRRIRYLHEVNPMLGTRGCRLGLLFPEIYEMQVRAIIRAAKAVQVRQVSSSSTAGDAHGRKAQRAGGNGLGKTAVAAPAAPGGNAGWPRVEIMHPLVGFAEELRRLRDMTEQFATEEGAPEGSFTVGSMIELPRACVSAGEIAEHADFFSFGTNDLTQTTLGFSRDDAEGKFLAHYLRTGVLTVNPFVTLDVDGVGALMKIAVSQARAVKPGIKMGICGEHGGDPESVGFCERIDLDYVSCSPYRVPLARLAAAQAVGLKE